MHVEPVMPAALFVFWRSLIALLVGSALAAAAAIGASNYKTRPVVIVGAGPVGLASALVLDDAGFSDITVIERRASSPSSFDSEKAYLYLIDTRGQKLTDSLGLTQIIAESAVASSKFTNITEVRTDGTLKTLKIPSLFASQKKDKYWVPRSVLVDLLLAKASARPSIRVQFDSPCAISVSSDGQGLVVSAPPGSPASSLKPQLLLGCDGYQSAVRLFLLSQHDGDGFKPQRLASASAGLRYKMLAPRHRFPLPTAAAAATDSAADDSAQPPPQPQPQQSQPGQAYAIRSTGNTRRTRLSLGLLPVTDGAPRTANIIAGPDHHIWTLRSASDVAAFLQKSFPQLSPLSDFVTDAEVARFAAAEPGTFPEPSFLARAVATVPAPASATAGAGAGAAGTLVALLGDSLHSFPPDLGQGVNSGLEDAYVLGQCLKQAESAACSTATGADTHTDTATAAVSGQAVLSEALRLYEAARVPEARALAHLMVYGYPYQYRQNRVMSALYAANFALRLGLNKLLPRIFHRPAFFIVQHDNPVLSYREVNKLAHRTTRAILKTGLVLALLVWGREAVATVGRPVLRRVLGVLLGTFAT